MKRIRQVIRSRQPTDSWVPGARSRGHLEFTWTAVLWACCFLGASSLLADTVFLKDGTQILDCQVTSETKTHVFLRTPVGDMAVPKTEIYRVLRVKTAFDRYKEQLAAIPEGDVNSLYKLALRCRAGQSLRKESDQLLAKVVKLSPNHTGARRLLGHFKIGKEWVVPPPLSIRIKSSKANAREIYNALDLFLKSRIDVRLATETPTRSDAGDSVDNCTFNASVVLSRRAATKFYGKALGQASFGATVRLEAKASWLGRTPLKTALDGQAPGDGRDIALAVQNAFSHGGGYLHKFLDQLTARRSKKLQEELRRKAREKNKKKKEAQEAP